MQSTGTGTAKKTGRATVVCQDKYINPLRLEGDGSDEENQQEGGDPTVGMGTGRRKKRSTVKRTLRNKRQETPTEQGLSENVTLVSNLHKDVALMKKKLASLSPSLELHIIRIPYIDQLCQRQM